MTDFDYSIIRPYPIEEHPLCVQNYLIPTVPISLAWELLDKVMRRRVGGFIIWGHLRIGKSSCIKYLQIAAKTKYKGLFTARIECESKTYISERDFFIAICEDLGLPTGGTASQCRRRAVRKMIELGKRNIKQLFVLFVDEAQKWLDIQMEWICETYNELEDHNVRLITVLVGQAQLTAVRESLIARRQGVIVTRFMNYVIPFRGISSPGELQDVLNTYDTLTDSLPDWPFTRFFFPMAYASGFRLETYAQLIWDGFIAVYELDGRFSDYWLPMKQITLVIETMFQEYFSLDAVDFVITEELVETLVGEAQFSLYLEFLHHEVAGEANVKR